jgi:23S rRNA pseudouridine1911/1915/1917 synthase
MSDSLHLADTIPDELAGMRLDQALAQVFPDYSRGRLTGWIKQGYVSVNGETLRPRDKVMGGEQIEINATIEVADENWTAEPISLDVVYEDDDVIIINKPAGLVVHPGAGNQNGTLVNALLHHVPQLETLPRAGIIHRIDKSTTGLLMVAKTLPAHHSLTTQLQKRTVIREYQAIVCGVMTAGGIVDEPVGRHHIDRKKMTVTDSGKHAVTHYRVVTRFRGHTHITCKLETGRTHQIRVHMAHIRYPLLGDPVYGGRLKLPKNTDEAFRTVVQGFRRQALHAATLGFVHPTTGENVIWHAVLPEDMEQMLAVLATDQRQAATEKR